MNVKEMKIIGKMCLAMLGIVALCVISMPAKSAQAPETETEQVFSNDMDESITIIRKTRRGLAEKNSNNFEAFITRKGYHVTKKKVGEVRCYASFAAVGIDIGCSRGTISSKEGYTLDDTAENDFDEPNVINAILLRSISRLRSDMQPVEEERDVTTMIEEEEQA